MNSLSFFNTFDVTIQLDRLECVKEFDQDGHSEPYLWSAFLQGDAGTLLNPGQRVEIHVPLEAQSAQGVFGEAGKGVRPGDVIQVPEILGRRLITVRTLKIGDQELLLAGFVVVLLERDSTPGDAIRAGHQMLGQALREEINEFVDDNLSFPTDDQIDQIKENVSQRVKNAIKAELSWYHTFIKQDDLVGFLGGEETLFTAERIKQWRGKGPQAFRTAIMGKEIFGSGFGPILEFEHHYELFWHVQVTAGPEVAPVHAPLLEQVEAAASNVTQLDAKIHQLGTAPEPANVAERRLLQAKIDELNNTRAETVRELAFAWESFVEAQTAGETGNGNEPGINRPDSMPILLKMDSIQGFVCQRKSKVSGKCYHGFSKLANCTNDCGVATIPDFQRLKMAFDLRVTGIIVDDVTDVPIEGMEVHLVLPNRKRYVARTRADGSFVLEVNREVSEEAQPESTYQDVGTLRTILAEAAVEEAGKIGIVYVFTDEFKASHPDLHYITLPAADLDCEIIYLS